MKTKKAIILLDQPYTAEITELQKSVSAAASASNFEVIKLLQVANNEGSNCGTLQELINIVTNQNKPANQPIAVIIKDASYISYYAIMTNCVLGTLEMSDLIDVYIYQESSDLIVREKEIKFLSIAWLHLAQLLRCAKEKGTI
jgi:hypothetical protein